MPLKNLFRSVKRYDVSTRNAYVVCIHLLNGSLIECTLTSESTGQECLENIAQRIQLSEVSVRASVVLFCSVFFLLCMNCAYV